VGTVFNRASTRHGSGYGYGYAYKYGYAPGAVSSKRWSLPGRAAKPARASVTMHQAARLTKGDPLPVPGGKRIVVGGENAMNGHSRNGHSSSNGSAPALVAIDGVVTDHANTNGHVVPYDEQSVSLEN
jgi:hypothetical protein